MAASVSIDRFDGADLWGEVVRDLGVGVPELEAIRLADPACALETIHWGRNYLYSAALTVSEGEIPVVVKQFRNRGMRARLRRRFRGSKAERSWRMALEMIRSGLRTPAPVMLIESRHPEGASLLVTRQVPGAIEARFVFRALKSGTFATEFPALDLGAFIEELGRTARRMHDAGFWHRDFSIGNVLITSAPGAPVELWVTDLNRARQCGRVSVSERTRDLCRMGFPEPRDELAMLAAYWSGRESGLAFKRWLYRIYRWSYLSRVEGRKGLRAAMRSITAVLFARQPHAHIPPPPEEAGVRDRAVWDRLSDQPHQHASRGERLRVRLADTGTHLRALTGATGAIPRVHRRYRRLRAALWSEPVAWPGVGVAVGPESAPVEAVLAALLESGARQVLLRLHPWETAWDDQQRLAAELATRGFDLTFALPQVRELVRDPRRWTAAIDEIGRRFLPFGHRFQIGQAINRSKWGVWNYREYSEMAAAAERTLRSLGEVEILGPAVIDFEPHALAAALNYPAGPTFDIVSSLLYVDRRGAPENTQLGFDALEKTALMKAVGDTARHGARRFWITEVNWPLWEGPHSPAGRTASVDEEAQADYLVRYLVPILGSGLAERAYWWQLIARGYGLIDPRAGGLRRRPSFRALKTLSEQLEGATCHGPVESPAETRLYRFTHATRGEVLVGWSLGGRVAVDLPVPAEVVVSRDGERVGSAMLAELGPSPRYFRPTTES